MSWRETAKLVDKTVEGYSFRILDPAQQEWSVSYFDWLTASPIQNVLYKSQYGTGSINLHEMVVANGDSGGPVKIKDLIKERASQGLGVVGLQIYGPWTDGGAIKYSKDYNFSPHPNDIWYGELAFIFTTDLSIVQEICKLDSRNFVLLEPADGWLQQLPRLDVVCKSPITGLKTGCPYSMWRDPGFWIPALALAGLAGGLIYAFHPKFSKKYKPNRRAEAVIPRGEIYTFKSGRRFGRRTPSAKYRRMGALLPSDYAWPAGYKYPIIFRKKDGTINMPLTRKHLRTAKGYFTKSKHLYPMEVRREIAGNINRVAKKYQVGGLVEV